jgi:DNA-binding IclR family transcriptional regulator
LIKVNNSTSRALAVLEAIAANQPVGVSELARRLSANKSAVQRAIVTLASSSWIHPAPGRPTRWELTEHIHAVAHMTRHPDDLRQRARRAMEVLRDETGETVILNVPDIRRFVVAEVVESRQLLRTAPFVGMTVSASESATGRAVLAYMDAERQAELLGRAPDRRLVRDFAITRERGYFVFPDDPNRVSTNIAAPVFGADGHAVAALVLSAPTERVPSEQQEHLGIRVARAAGALSRSAAHSRAHRS